MASHTPPCHTPPPLAFCHDCSHSPWVEEALYPHTAQTLASGVDSQTVVVDHGIVVVVACVKATGKVKLTIFLSKKQGSQCSPFRAVTGKFTV